MTDIVDTVIKAGSFNTLLAAVKATRLIDTLKSEDTFTLFVPNDTAFANLPEGTVEELLKDVPTLIKVLTYQAALGKVRTADIAKKVC